MSSSPLQFVNARTQPHPPIAELLLGRVSAVNLEHVLGDIQTDRGNLHVGGSPHVIRLRRTTL